MGADEKAKNQAEQATGKVKEGLGGATDNESLKQEGKKDQVKADAKQVGEDVKDTVKDGTDKKH